MQTLAESLIEQGLSNRILSERQLERAVGGEAARRYGLVNRALKANELVRDALQQEKPTRSPRARTPNRSRMAWRIPVRDECPVFSPDWRNAAPSEHESTSPSTRV